MSDEKLNAVYSERNRLAAGFARMALAAGFRAGVGVDPGKWPVLYVETPNGQVSWHIAEQDDHVLEGLPTFSGEWDGSFRGRESNWSVWPIGRQVTNSNEDIANGISLGFDEAATICRHLAKEYLAVEGEPPVGVMKESKEADGAEACADAILEARAKFLETSLSNLSALPQNVFPAPLGSSDERLLGAMKVMVEAVRVLQHTPGILETVPLWPPGVLDAFERATSLIRETDKALEKLEENNLCLKG